MTSLRGNLSAVDLANIFQMLAMNQREGTLWIYDAHSRKAIYFGQDGVSMLARARARPESIGRILLRLDKIAPEQLEDALRSQADSDGLRLGELLVERGLLTAQDVEEALQIQVEEDVYSLFIWKDAQFEFVEGPPDEDFRGGEEVTRLAFNPNSLLMEASKRVDEWEWIRKVVPSAEEVYRYTGRNVPLEDEIFTRPWAGKVLGAIDGRRSVDEIVDVSCVHRFDVMKILALLVESRATEALPVEDLRAEARRALDAQDADQAVKFLSRLVALKGDTPDMHRQLAQAFERRRRLERAAFHYKVYAEILAGNGDRKQAFETYRRICDLLPTDIVATDRMIEIFASNPDGLEEHAGEVIARGKSLAEVYGELGRRSRAIQVLHRVVALGPEDPDLRQRLIQVYLQSGMVAEAVVEYEAVAEAALAAHDYDQAERIYRKVLQLGGRRDEARSRLNQIVAHRRLRMRGIRLGVAAAVFAAVVAVAGVQAWKWHVEQQQRHVANRESFSRRFQELRARNEVVFDELEHAARALTTALQDPAAMAEQLRQGGPRKELLARAVAAVRESDSLADEFAEVETSSDARDSARVVERKLAHVRAQEERVRTALDRALDDQLDRLEPWPPEIPLADLDRDLRTIVSLAEAAPGWRTGEKGVRAQAYARNVGETLTIFHEVRDEVAALRAKNETAAAQTRLLAYLTSDLFPSRDLLEQIEFPRIVVSRPEGARVLVDGVDTGLVTPASVWIPVLKPATIRMVKDGFEPAEVVVRGLETLDRQRMLDLPKCYDRVLRKEVAFRTPALGARLAATPAVVGDRIVVPTRGSETAVLDFRGAVRRSLPTKAASGVQVRPVVIGDDVVLATYDGTLFHFNADGTLLERVSIGGKVQADPAQWEHLVLVADLEGRVTAYDVRNRRRSWTYPANGQGHPHGFRTAPVVHDGELYVLGGDGVVCVLDPASGDLCRRQPLREANVVRPLASGIAVAGDYVFVVARVDKNVSRLLCFDRDSLSARSAVTIEGSVRFAPLPWRDRVHVVTDDGVVWTVRSEGGNLSSAHPTRLDQGTRAAVEPVLADGFLYLGDSSGAVWALDVRGRQPQRHFEFRIPAAEKRPVRMATRPLVTATHVIFGADDNAVYGLAR